MIKYIFHEIGNPAFWSCYLANSNYCFIKYLTKEEFENIKNKTLLGHVYKLLVSCYNKYDTLVYRVVE